MGLFDLFKKKPKDVFKDYKFTKINLIKKRKKKRKRSIRKRMATESGKDVKEGRKKKERSLERRDG